MSEIPHNALADRINFLVMGIVVAFIIIFFRLFYLQIYLNQEFLRRSHHNFLRTEQIPSRRGNILDATGNLIATNKPIVLLYWQGTGSKQLQPHQYEILTQLSELLEKPLTDKEYIVAIKEAERTGKKTLLFSEVPFDTLSKITEKFPNCPNVFLATDIKRCYPYKTLACHVIGYINSLHLDQGGKMGLEKILDEDLKGEPGELLKTINSLGANLYQEEIKQALAGKDSITTLEISLQIIAEEIFPFDSVGSLILMDPRTGAIKALVSRPSFDPEIFLAPLHQDCWDALQINKPFLNRALTTSYPPASLFKLVTLSAALEYGIITPETMSYCKGYTRFRGRKYHCGNQLGHGLLSIKESIAQSCNILFFEIAKRLPIDVLADYAHRFGLGEKTDILLPENNGLVPSTIWKQTVKHEPWWPGETLSAVIGQSYLLVTPMQIACMVGSIFEGYRVRPRILEQEPILRKPLQLKKETRHLLKDSMEAVVENGLAMRLRTLKGFKIYAKTGTAQVVALEKKEFLSDQQFMEHAWCALHFTYQQEDPLLLVLLVEHTGSSKVTTKIAKNFLVAYKNYRNTQLS